MDTVGINRQHVLFKEHAVSDPIIQVGPTGYTGINTIPNEPLTVVGNVIFLGNDTAPSISNIHQASSPNYMAWVANKSALRIGESTQGHAMFNDAAIGQFSMAFGRNTSAAGRLRRSASNTSMSSGASGQGR